MSVEQSIKPAPFVQEYIEQLFIVALNILTKALIDGDRYEQNIKYTFSHSKLYQWTGRKLVGLYPH